MIKQTWAVTIFTGFYLIVALAVSIMVGNNEFILYLALAPFLMAGAADECLPCVKVIIHKRACSKRLSSLYKTSFKG